MLATASVFFCTYERRSLVPNQPDTICVVDDDTSLLKALGRLLSSEGLRMTGFSNPRLFLEHAKEHKVALVIIDVWMPELSGLEVTPDDRAVYASHHHDRTGRSWGGSHRVCSRRRRFFCQAV